MGILGFLALYTLPAMSKRKSPHDTCIGCQNLRLGHVPTCLYMLLNTQACRESARRDSFFCRVSKLRGPGPGSAIRLTLALIYVALQICISVAALLRQSIGLSHFETSFSGVSGNFCLFMTGWGTDLRLCASMQALYRKAAVQSRQPRLYLQADTHELASDEGKGQDCDWFLGS